MLCFWAESIRSIWWNDVLLIEEVEGLRVGSIRSGGVDRNRLKMQLDLPKSRCRFRRWFFQVWKSDPVER